MLYLPRLPVFDLGLWVLLSTKVGAVTFFISVVLRHGTIRKINSPVIEAVTVQVTGRKPTGGAFESP